MGELVALGVLVVGAGLAIALGIIWIDHHHAVVRPLAREVSMSGEFVAKGRNGQLTVKERSIVISRRGAMAFLTQGLKGDKEIPIEHVTSVQMKNPGLTVGYVQFTFMGGQEAKGGVFEAGHDENSISFDKNAQKAFEYAKQLIEERRRAATAHGAAATLSPADELAKFAELHRSGVLTDDEFAAKKNQLLGR